MDFGKALEHLKAGQRVTRPGWSGKGMWLFLVYVWSYLDASAGDSPQKNYPNLPFIAMKTADDKVVPWLASQTDILASDWDLAQ